MVAAQPVVAQHPGEPATPPLHRRLRTGQTSLVQLGLGYSTAVRDELRVPALEVLVRPLPYVSASAHAGQVSTQRLPELFAGARGKARGWDVRLHYPIIKGEQGALLDLYLAHGKTAGNLPYAVDAYVPGSDTHAYPFRTSAEWSGRVAFRQNNTMLGIRLYPCRWLYLDFALGYRQERFIFEGEHLERSIRGPQGEGGIYSGVFDFVDELPPNQWIKRDRFTGRVGIGIRL